MAPSAETPAGAIPTNDNPTSSLPPTVCPSNAPQSTPVQCNHNEPIGAYVAKITAAMDGPPEEFAKKTAESSKSRDRESTQLQEFVLNHSYDEILRELLPFEGYLTRFRENKHWYEQVVAVIRAQV